MTGHLLGARGKRSWIGATPLCYHEGISDYDAPPDDPLYTGLVNTEGGTSLIELSERPDMEAAIGGYYPIEITKDQWHQFLFRMREFDMTMPDGVDYGGPRFSDFIWDGTDEYNPSEADLLFYPGMRIRQRGTAPGSYKILGIGSPVDITGPVRWYLGEDGERVYTRYTPWSRNYPTLHGDIHSTSPILNQAGGLELWQQGVACALFWGDYVYPYIRLEATGVGGAITSPGNAWVVSSNNQYYNGSGYLFATSAKLRIFDWGEVPLWIIIHPAVDRDVFDLELKCTSYYGYDGAFDTQSGAQLMSDAEILQRLKQPL